jgi:hypothetical protein
MMHPFVESNIASCRKDMERAVEALEKAIATSGPEVWELVGIARMRVQLALSRLQAAVKLEEMRDEMMKEAAE